MCNFKGNSRHVDLMIRLGVSSTCRKLQTEIDALGNKVERVFQDLSFSVFVRLIEILLLWEFNYVKNLPIELCRVLTYSKSYFMLTYQLVFKSSLLINKTTSKYVSVMWKSQVPSASRRCRVQFKHERLRCNKQKKVLHYNFFSISWEHKIISSHINFILRISWKKGMKKNQKNQKPSVHNFLAASNGIIIISFFSLSLSTT